MNTYVHMEVFLAWPHCTYMQVLINPLVSKVAKVCLSTFIVFVSRPGSLCLILLH